MQMAEGLDTGDILMKATTAIEPDDTGGSLHDRLADMGARAIVAALARLETRELPAEPQDDAQATYAHKLSKDEGRIHWSQPVEIIERQIRAFNPWPGSYTDLGDQRLRIHQAKSLDSSTDAAPGTVIARTREGIDVACGKGILRIESLQLPGARPQSASDLINGGKALLLPGQELH